MYSYFYPSESFITFVKKLENSQRTGFDEDKKLWFPHGSPEGGLPTLAYGHKIKRNELDTLQNGVSDDIATNLLLSDIEAAYLAVVGYVTNRIGSVDLTERQTEMLVEFAFNLGTLRGFPKFTVAVVNNDLKTVKREYKRYYTSAAGERLELTRRNELFAKRFLV